MSKYKKHICCHCGETVKYTLQSKPKVCPSCEHPYSMKPIDEYKLLVAQDEYLNSGKSEEAFRKMYPPLYLYTKKILLKCNKGKVSLSEDQVEEKTLEAVSDFVEKYLKNESFRITDSIGGYLGWVVRGVLYGYHVKKNDQERSLNHKLEKYGNKSELIHKFYSVTNNTLCFKEYDVEKDVLDHVEVDGVLDDINYLIDKGREVLRIKCGLEASLSFLYGIQHFLEKKSERFMINYFEYIDIETKEMIDDIKNKIYSYLVSLKTGESIES